MAVPRIRPVVELTHPDDSIKATSVGKKLDTSSSSGRFEAVQELPTCCGQGLMLIHLTSSQPADLYMSSDGRLHPASSPSHRHRSDRRHPKLATPTGDTVKTSRLVEAAEILLNARPIGAGNRVADSAASTCRCRLRLWRWILRYRP